MVGGSPNWFCSAKTILNCSVGLSARCELWVHWKTHHFCLLLNICKETCYLPIAMLWWLISMKSSGLDNWKTRQSCFLLIIICQTGTVTIAFHLCAICQLHMCCHLQRHDYKSNINQFCLNKDTSRNLSCTANAVGAVQKPQLVMYLVCTSASTSTSTSELHQNPLR